MKFKEIIKIIKLDGWFQVRQVGSHQQYHHLTKRGTVTIAGKSNEEIHPKTLKSILTQAQIKI
ncbi:MAG: type II toxin-antitoxin system HicA family toxin [Ignavibacteria bacterium]|nr:type II toxin-antitoxin system HicA family toxin [Ignavibacteria bacterium]